MTELPSADPPSEEERAASFAELLCDIDDRIAAEDALADWSALPERITRRLVEQDGCWLWQGPRKSDGYVSVSWEGQNRSLHRITYEVLRGPIPDGLTIDHLCRTRHCANPAHMEAVTQYENNMRGDSPAAIAARATSCKHGHEFTPENTYIQAKSGKRFCRACLRRRDRERRARLASTG